MKSCLSLEVAPQHGGSKDVDGQELCAEVSSVSNMLPKPMAPQEVLSYIMLQATKQVRSVIPKFHCCQAKNIIDPSSVCCQWGKILF